MRDMEEIMEAYKKADSAGRLNYYLEYPSLRSDFMEVERNNGQRTNGYRVKNLFKKCFGWVKNRRVKIGPT